jgi:hypothetical protein
MNKQVTAVVIIVIGVAMTVLSNHLAREVDTTDPLTVQLESLKILRLILRHIRSIEHLLQPEPTPPNHPSGDDDNGFPSCTTHPDMPGCMALLIPEMPLSNE